MNKEIEIQQIGMAAYYNMQAPDKPVEEKKIGEKIFWYVPDNERSLRIIEEYKNNTFLQNFQRCVIELKARMNLLKGNKKSSSYEKTRSKPHYNRR